MDQATSGVSLPLTPPLVSLFQQILLSLTLIKHAPVTKTTFSDEYDYIIVGAGSAGSVLASRLSEMSCVTVLLLEAGASPPLASDVPGFSFNLRASDLDWQFLTTPQRHGGSAFSNRRVPLTLGKAVGGSSIINNMVFYRGNRHNYNQWAKMGAKGWSYGDVLPYFIKSEDYRVKKNVANGYHGVTGPLTISKSEDKSRLKEILAEAVVEEGYEINDDPNAQKQWGLYEPQVFIRDGRRCSTAKAYLVPSENRTNLDILPNAMVTKIDIQDKKAVGVNFLLDGEMQYVKAKKEVIVSAGAYNTPKLLMLSGIGPKLELAKFGIPLIADLPVGHNLQEHIVSSMYFVISDKFPKMTSQIFSERSFESYINDRSGPLGAVPGFLLSLLFNSNKTAQDEDLTYHNILFVNGNLPSPSREGLKPEILTKLFSPYGNKTILTCQSQLAYTRSKGYVRLASDNIEQPPEINPNFFANLQDVKDLVEGFKACKKIIENPILAELDAKMISLDYPGCEKFSGDNDKFYECAVKAFFMTNGHHCGTAKMGDSKDPTTVVDPELKVKTIDGLRVVDASIMPTIPWGSPNAPVIMIAEKASDIIKKTIKCNEKYLKKNKGKSTLIQLNGL